MVLAAVILEQQTLIAFLLSYRNTIECLELSGVGLTYQSTWVQTIATLSKLQNLQELCLGSLYERTPYACSSELYNEECTDGSSLRAEGRAVIAETLSSLQLNPTTFAMKTAKNSDELGIAFPYVIDISKVLAYVLRQYKGVGRTTEN